MAVLTTETQQPSEQPRSAKVDDYDELLAALSEISVRSRPAETPRAGSPGCRLTLRSFDASQRPQIARLWRRLEADLAAVPLSGSWTWTDTWLDHYGDLVPHEFVVGLEGDLPRGICLMTQGVGRTNGPVAVRTLHLGTAGEPDADRVCVEHNALCVEQSWHTEFVQRLVEFIDARPDWDEFHLDDFVDKDAATFLQYGQGWKQQCRVSRIHHLAAARAAGTDAIAQLGTSTRKVIRKNLKAYDGLQTEWAKSLSQAHAIFDDLVRLHQARWTAVGHPGSYASRRFHDFHRDIIDRLLPTGQAALFRVKSGPSLVGCNQLFIDRNRALCYQGGAAPYQDKRSPGLVTDYLCIEECCRRGLDDYDFLAGDSHHKQRLSTTSCEMVYAVRSRPRIMTTLVNALRKIKQRVQQQDAHGKTTPSPGKMR